MNVKANTDDADEALLAEFNLTELPVTFTIQNADNSVVQEREACYLCLSGGFYGRSVHGTWYEEGSIIVTDAVPNSELQPLNRAAAIRVAKWLRNMPKTRVPIDIGDMAEASQMLAKNPEVQQLNPIEYQKVLLDICEQLKIKRGGREAFDLPAMSPHNFTRHAANSKAPPILGAKMADMGQVTPGQTRAATMVPAGTAPGPRKAAVPMGHVTPPSR